MQLLVSIVGVFLLLVCSAQAQTFDKSFWIAHSVMWGSAIADAEITHEGIAHRRCLEGNNDLPARPTRGELYRSDLPGLAVITGLNILIRHAKVPGSRWIMFGDTAYDTQIHVRGAASWLGRCW